MGLPKFICKRVISMTLFIFVSWTIAGAYTIVFYGGKRVEIPDNFIVTSDAVIYEASPGVNVSFRLKSIDVPATERANNDASGSLLGRISAGRVQAPPPITATQKATRTITNRDLEPYERARVRSEASWEERRKELGLPSLEETRREAAAREAALDQFLARKRREEAENYWREREAELRAEMAARMNTIDYQSGQYYWPTGIVTVENGQFGPFYSRFRFRRGFTFRLRQGSPCGFNASPSCLTTHPFSLFNQRAFPARRTIVVAPRTIVGGPRGGGVFVSPGRHH
jgi:hypothetical protein